MSLDERDYREKNTWRRTVWNRIAERVSRPAAECSIVYLPAEADLDREAAIRRGFREHNLIAVERDAKKVEALRQKRTLCINCDVFEFLHSYDRRIDVIHLDFCGGLTARIYFSLLNLLLLPTIRKAVISLNFLRGRDADLNVIRQHWGEILPSYRDGRPVHRGAVLLNQWTVYAIWAAVGLLEIRDGQTQLKITAQTADLQSSFLQHREGAFKAANPWKTEYLSTSGQKFDSIVFANPLRNIISESWGEADKTLLSGIRRGRARPKVAAFLAHQTRRREQNQ